LDAFRSAIIITLTAQDRLTFSVSWITLHSTAKSQALFLVETVNEAEIEKTISYNEII
jgi:hypothetical protein